MAGKGKEASMNRAEESPHKAGGVARPHPAGGKKHEAGAERKPDMKGALGGSPEDGSVLHGAVKHLHSEHPIAHDDHGPHHGGSHHIRHEPLHGMRHK